MTPIKFSCDFDVNNDNVCDDVCDNNVCEQTQAKNLSSLKHSLMLLFSNHLKEIKFNTYTNVSVFVHQIFQGKC